MRAGEERSFATTEIISISSLWTFRLYVAISLYIVCISLGWYGIAELPITLIISFIAVHAEVTEPSLPSGSVEIITSKCLRSPPWFDVADASVTDDVYMMVFNATFNNISVISWRSVLFVEEAGGPGENHRPVASHWQTLSHNVVHFAWSRFEHTTSVVVGTDCIGSCKTNYHATTDTTDPVTDDHIYCQFVVVATLPFFLLSWLSTRLLTTDASSGTGNSAPNKFALDFHWFHVVQIAFITVIHFTVNVGSSIMNTTHTF
jgi:hypothetical protein